jgi:hypothetical protein
MMRRPAEGALLMSPTIRRELILDHGRVIIECPRLMTNADLADILAAFVDQVRGGKANPAVPEPKVEAKKSEPVLKRPKKGSGP